MNEEVKQATIKIADAINNKRRKEIFQIYSNEDIFKYIAETRRKGEFDRGASNGSHMRKVATIPPEVDQFFTKYYGADYYKDPEFFSKKHPEWRVINEGGSGAEQDRISFIREGLRA